MRAKTKNLIILFLLISTICGCSKNNPVTYIEEETIDELEEILNSAPNDFDVVIKNVSSDMATINWTQAIDPENDSVTYSLYLNHTLIIEGLSVLTYQLDNLTDQTDYSGQIIAKDFNNNETIKTFSFRTEKYYLKYLKKYNYFEAVEEQYQDGGTPYSMIKTLDGNYLLAGKANFDGYGSQFFLLKIDYEGNELWRKYHEYRLLDTGQFKIIHSSTGYILAGYHHILSLDYEGNLIWYKKIESYDNGYTFNQIKSVALDSQGNIFAIGGRSSIDPDIDEEAVITKIDNLGNIIWEKVYTPSIRNFFNDLLITSKNELIVLGSTETNGATAPLSDVPEQIDFWVLKLTNDGEEIWTNTYGDVGYDFPEKIIRRVNGNYILAGYAWGAYDISNGILFEIDQNGNEIWYSYNDLPYIYDISETLDNGLIATGRIDYQNSSGLAFHKFDNNGNEEWHQIYREAYTYLSGRSLLIEEDGGYRITGSLQKNYYSSGERPKLVIIKTDDKGEFE